MTKTTRNIPPTLSTDADCLAAEREIAEVRAAADKLRPAKNLADENRRIKPLTDRMWAFYDLIVSSPPVSLASAAVKLRLLCDPDIGLDAGGNEEDVEAVRQVFGLVERVVGDGDAELLALIAEYQRRNEKANASKISDKERAKRCAHADELRDKIDAIRPTTWRGVLAVLDYGSQLEDPSYWPDQAVEGLREIVGRPASDDAILSLFRQWLETARSASASKEDFGGGLDERVWALERQLHDAPASGAVGLAIKGYMIAYHEAGDISRGAEPGALTAFDPDDSYAPNGTLQLGKRALKGLIEDAIRVVPELAPLAAGIFDTPPQRPSPPAQAEFRARVETLVAERDAGLIEAERKASARRRRNLSERCYTSREVDEGSKRP
jgi:hypothetical protein